MGLLPDRPAPDERKMMAMGFRLNLSLLLTILFGLTSVTAGTIGWLNLSQQGYTTFNPPLTQPIGPSEAIYRALQALTLSEGYTAMNWAHDPLLVVARFGGFLTTLSAFFALIIGMIGSRLAFWRESWRRNHVVVLLDDGFVLSYLRSLYVGQGKRVTAYVASEQEAALKDLSAGGLRVLPMPRGGLPRIGRPSHVVFGDRMSIRNIENARLLLTRLAPGTRLTIRIEQPELSRIQAGLPKELLAAEFLSRNQITAEGLIGALDLGGLAEIRGQGRPHLAIIGFGSCAVSIAEEVALRIHRFAQDRPVVSVFDIDRAGAEQRLQQLCVGLSRALDIRFYPLDGLVCNTARGLEMLSEVEREQPFTAIVIATGQDELNMAIALRLARVQQDELFCKAPILVRNSKSDRISPAPLSELCQGVRLFGGDGFDRRSLAIQRFTERVARLVHETWIASLPEQERAVQAWELTSPRHRASSRRAVLSGQELLRSTGLEAEPGHDYCGFRGYRPHIEARLSDTALIERLARIEHERWCAEKHADGFRQPENGPRDDERRLHPLLVPYDDLDDKDRQKDRDQVRAILGGSMMLFDRTPQAPCWRHRLRIGVVGTILPDQKVLESLADIAARLARIDLPVPFEQAMLEIISPNAPGFDRLAAVGLLKQHFALTGRRGNVLLLQAVREETLDRLAQPRVPADTAASQSAELRAAAHHIRRVDLRPHGLSDTDIKHRALLQQQFELAANEVDRLSDLVVFGLGDGPGEYTRSLLKRRRIRGKACLVLDEHQI